MNEALTKATQSLQFAASELREALAKATAVEALIVYPILERVGQARSMTAELASALVLDGKERAK